jgi:hypothetical protein
MLIYYTGRLREVDFIRNNVNYRTQKLNKFSLTRKYLLQKQNIINRSATCIITMFVFHVTLLNILGFVHLPEKVLDKYFEIKGVLNLITCSMFLGGKK